MKKQKRIFGILLCLVVGGITGLLGGGGGMLCVPVLTFFFCLEPKKAHASAILVMFLTTICASFMYFFNKSLAFDWGFVLTTAVVSICGSFVGTKLLFLAKNKVINLIFSLVVLLAGGFMVLR